MSATFSAHDNSSFKLLPAMELQNFILCVNCVWSLFCSKGIYLRLHVLPILFYIKNRFISNYSWESNLLSNFYSWTIFSKQQNKTPDIPKVFSECSAVFF